MNNQQIIEKATMTLSDLASGGRLNAQQFNTFYRKMIDSPTIMKEARNVIMTSDQMKIEKLGFGQRVLRPGVEGQQLSEQDKAAPTTSTVNLTAKEVIAEVNITYDTLENNIEGDRLYDTIMAMLAERAALDLEELALNGDTASSDPYLALFDGIRKQADQHIVDANGAPLTKGVFKNLYNAIPKKYLRNPGDWRFYTSYANELEWRDLVGARQTNLGDTAFNGSQNPNAFGVPVKGIAMLQEYEATIGESPKEVNDVIFVQPKNIITGFSRNVTVEFDKDIRARKFIVVLTAKVDVEIEERDAIAKAIHVDPVLS